MHRKPRNPPSNPWDPQEAFLNRINMEIRILEIHKDKESASYSTLIQEMSFSNHKKLYLYRHSETPKINAKIGNKTKKTNIKINSKLVLKQ